MGEENMPEKRDNHKETETESQTRVKTRLKESSVVDRQHMSEQTIGQRDGTRNSQVEHGEAGLKVESFQSVEMFHENGKVSSPKEKCDGKLIKSRKDPLMGMLNTKDMEDKMKWDEVLDEVANVKSEEGRKHKQEINSTGCADKENQHWAEIESSPLAMSYDQEKGWTLEILGPKSGH